ncbi:MAG TPA: hypothetical protein VG890_04900 [Puia sp.]|nr:hypothetical protein [Puia sp.]
MMSDTFQLHFGLLNRVAEIRRSPYSLVILREGQYTVSVDKLPLTEYFIYFDSPVKSDQYKLKFYKTADGKWYDKALSEEAELHSPEFGVPEFNAELKAAIDAYEKDHSHVRL